MMPDIRFTHNWNGKLDNTIFTTIRRNIPQTLAYYSQSINRELDVLIDGEIYCRALLRRITARKLGELPTAFICVDTGTPNRVKAHEIFRRFGLSEDDEVLVLLFERVDDV